MKTLNRNAWLKRFSIGLAALAIGTASTILMLDRASAIVQGDGLLLYGASSNTNPQVRSYTSPDTFGAAGGTVNGTQALSTLVRTSPTKYEAIAGYVNSSGTLQIMCYDGTGWSNEWSVSVGGTGTTRPFDIAYENNSGKVVVLYGNNGASLGYRTKANSSGCGAANWTSASTFTPARTSGTVQWVKMVADKRSGSNLIAATWADNASDLSAQIWSGSAWGNEPSSALATSLEFVTAAQDTDNFDLEYESSSGDLMVVWGIAGTTGTTNLIKYAACTGGTSGCTWGAATSVTTVADSATEIDIASNPVNDQISLVAVDKGGGANSCDMSGGLWGGSSWQGLSNVDSTVECPTAGQRTVSTFFLNNGATSRWVLVYDDASGAGIQWKTYSGITVTAQTAFGTTPSGDIRNRFASVVNPFDGSEATVTLTDGSSGLYAKRLKMDASGSFTWTNADGNASLGTVSQAAVGDFSYDYWRYIPNPTYDQTAYRWYDNANSVTPGSALANENTAHTLTSIASPIRLRTQLTLSTDPVFASSQAFKLQYATSTSGPWTDVGAAGGDTWCNDTSGITCTTSWGARRKITFNNSASGTNLTDFPVLVKVDSSRIDYSKTQSSGQDIRFVDPSDPNTVLPYEIETWNESGDSYIWVKVPQINASSTTDYIWMYYDNASASDGQDEGNVWNSNFAAVYHQEETTGTTLFDSTLNDNNAAKVSSTSPNPGTGKVGGAQVYSGSGSKATAPDSNSLDMASDLTVSAWVNASALNSWGAILCKDGSFAPNYCVQLDADNSNKFQLNYTSSFTAVDSTTIPVTGTWYYITGSIDDTTNTGKIYVNGVLEGTSGSFTATPPVNTSGLDIGTDVNDEYWAGTIDEVRVSSGVESADWIKADYLTQTDAMNSFGSEQTPADVAPATWGFYGNATPADGATLSSNVLTGTNVSETYQETNPTPVNPNAITVGQKAEWDFSLDPTNAIDATTYYFRMVKGDGTALGAYSQYPQIIISLGGGGGPTLDQQMRGGQAVVNGTKSPFSF